MLPFVLEQCQRFIAKLKSKPITNLIQNDWTDLSGKLTLDKICEKLDSGVYATLFDFFLDLRLLLELRDPQNPSNSTINIILEDITQWLIYKFHNMPRCQEELEFLKVNKMKEKIKTIFRAMIVKSENSETGFEINSPATQPLASPKMPQAGQKRLEVLQQRIEHLKTPTELQAILRILQKHISSFSLAPEVVIEGRYITKACANELRDYLNTVNA